MRNAPHFIAGIAALLSSTLFTACSSGSSGVVVTVNGQPIREAVVLQHLRQRPESGQILGHLIEETLISQYAAQHHVVVTDAEVAAREAELKAQLPGNKWNAMLSERNLPESGVPTMVRTELLLDKIVANDVRVSPADVKDYYLQHRGSFRGESLSSATPQITAKLQVQQSAQYSLGVMEDLTRQAKIEIHDRQYAELFKAPKVPSGSAAFPMKMQTQ